MATCYLNEPVCGGHPSYTRYKSVTAAKAAFRAACNEVYQFGNTSLSATIHIANSKAEIVDDADYFLEMGPNGGMQCHKG